MATFSDIATSLRVTTQLPLDHKRFSISEAELADLGDDNNLAYTYYDNLKVFCWDEKTEWVWREVETGEEDTGLLGSDFTYPNGIVYPNPGYANKTYNFFEIVPGVDTKVVAGANTTVTGLGSSTSPYVINSTATYTPPVSDISPLETLNEGNGNGIIKRGRTAANYGNIGLNAFDISTSSSASPTRGATGSNSFTQGTDVEASQSNSVSIGNLITNAGANTTCIGNLITSFAINSFIAGRSQESSGKGNTILGIANQGNGAGLTILGQAANIISIASTDYNSILTKPVLAVGNGVVDNTTNTATTRSDAFLVRYNGAVEAPSLTMAGIDMGAGRTLVTREYLTFKIGVSEGNTISEVNDTIAALKIVPQNRGKITGINLGSTTFFDTFSGNITNVVSVLNQGLQITLQNAMPSLNYVVKIYVEIPSGHTVVYCPYFKTISTNQFYINQVEDGNETQNLTWHFEVLSLD